MPLDRNHFVFVLCQLLHRLHVLKIHNADCAIETSSCQVLAVLGKT